MKIRNATKLAIVAANCLGLVGLMQGAPSGSGVSHMSGEGLQRPASAHQTTTSARDRDREDRPERRQEHIEQLRERRQEHVEQLTEKRQEHIEQFRERRDDRADSSTTQTGTHIKN
jgi:TolA-binding protein